MDVLEERRTRRGKVVPMVKRWRWCVSSMQDALSHAAQEWRGLALSTEAPPMAFPLWYASLDEAFGEIDDPVTVHQLYDGDRLVAVLPLSFSGGICHTWRPYQYRKYTPFWTFAFDARVDGIGQEICRHLLSSADMLDLMYMLADSGPVPYLVDRGNSPRVVLEEDEDEADVYNPLDAPWEQCLTHVAPRLGRQTRQHQRRFQRQGDLVLSVHTEPEGLKPLLTECLELERSGWKGRNGTAICCVPKVECFYRGLADRAAQEGMLALYTLRLNERLLACNFSLRSGKRIDALKIAYDERLSQGSPGNVMNYMILERECQEGRFASFHWGNPSVYKMRWTDCRNRLVRVLLFADGPVGGCRCLAHTRLRPLVRQCRNRLKRAAGVNKEQ